MRILAITAGAGNMYCGSCLRDNALATALQARGHDVTLLPTYTPTLTDEPNVSEDRVFFGGVSVYLEQNLALFRHTPAIFDRLWDASGVIRFFTGRGVSVEPQALGELTVSMLRGEDGFQAKELAKLAAWLRTQPRFDLVVLPNALMLGLAPTLRRAGVEALACTLQGEDLFLDGLLAPFRTDAEALIRGLGPQVDAFVSVSRHYADAMATRLLLARERIKVVPLGINVEGFEPRPRAALAPFTIGYFARVAPEKGLHVLAEIYRTLRRQHGLAAGRLLAAGYLAPEHRSYLDGLTAGLRDAGLGGEFEYSGSPDRGAKIRFLQDCDVLCVPSPYVEPKGLYLLEAMACGVPVVAPRHGALVEMVETTGGGVLVAPNDASAFAAALLALARDPEARARLGRKGARGVREQYTASHMAERAENTYAEIAANGAARQRPRQPEAGGARS